MRIAVVTHNWHGSMGGIEKYNRTLYENFPNHHFTEFPLFYKENVKSNFENVELNDLLNNKKSRPTIWLKAYSKNKMSWIFENFDLVLFSTNAPARKWIKNSKAIVIQHMDKSWYFMKQKSLSDKFAKLFSWIFGIDTLTNTLKRSRSVMYYSVETSFNIKGQNSWFAPLTSEVANKDLKRSGAIYIGRIDKKHKNIPELVRVANSIENIEIFGAGKDEWYIHRNLISPQKFKGALPSADVSDKLQTKRVFIMTSNYEGFSYSIVEALANGCAVCLYNTFDACKLFAKCPSVFLFEKNAADEMIDKAKEIDALSKEAFNTLSESSKNFAKEHLSNSVFLAAWKQIIK